MILETEIEFRISRSYVHVMEHVDMPQYRGHFPLQAKRQKDTTDDGCTYQLLGTDDAYIIRGEACG